eukprot:TRINITY_DN32691_c0_g1_i1.p1 TRINITY_DN32691_c0_g1~~TRINITY_DN32691_c0_g1_i1.p1  ORF type:complete len:185 (+),score=28.66 TRINITY_DN32691_c0_g1_i1:86-640(+)
MRAVLTILVAILAITQATIYQCGNAASNSNYCASDAKATYCYVNVAPSYGGLTADNYEGLKIRQTIKCENWDEPSEKALCESNCPEDVEMCMKQNKAALCDYSKEDYCQDALLTVKEGGNVCDTKEECSYMPCFDTCLKCNTMAYCLTQVENAVLAEEGSDECIGSPSDLLFVSAVVGVLGLLF